ncbi:Protein of uncharacterised function DUF262 [Serratia entomophila]|uniref:GmrSD restriction endonuclease domain-containing protein n=1 Tax=Serratia entomophila TaxID=42906 RepID=UPI0021778AC9|nr:DUF262 domain-containing protein [Serratia entomophila]CAI0967022.1 Protein of uncharacterised function DUF262 [Serratia entomophila]CAI1812998.1 Protein of uncharacterised function DUF262 [Serratia entomophila]
MVSENLDIDSKTVEELYSWYLSDNLIVNRRYQRKLVWSIDEKTALISSIIEQYPIPLLLFVTIESKREILDGMQRLEAIMSFIEQRFPVDGKYFDLDSIALTKELKDNGRITQKSPLLSRETSTKIARYKFAISEYSSTDSNIDEVFRRINSNGKILSKQELRSAGCISNFSDLVSEISTIIRGDTSHSNTLNLNKMHNISINNDGLDYGIDIEDHFYVKNHILTRKSIRDSSDEELVANMLGYIFLDDKPTSGSTSLDAFYGIYDTQHSAEQRALLESYIQTNGSDVIKQRFISVYETVLLLFNGRGISFNSHIIGQESTSQECPRYYQAVFLSIYEIMINRSMELSNADALFNQLKNVGKSVIQVTDGGRWASRTRQTSVDDLAAIILRHFKPSTRGYINHAWITEINQILMNSKSEQPNYDFKQGLLSLSGDNAFSDDCLKSIIQTCVAINNIAKKANGYILIGVSDKKETTKRLKKIHGIEGIDINGFTISGIDHEANIISGSLDNYFLLIKQKISSFNFSEQLKQQILKDIECCSYHNKHIIKITVKSTGNICSLDDKFYIRQGSSSEKIVGADKIAALFTNYMQ